MSSNDRPPVNVALKFAIHGSKHRTQRAFCDHLNDDPKSLAISEAKLSNIINGRTKAKPAERRVIAWKLQKSIAELFPSEEVRSDP